MRPDASPKRRDSSLRRPTLSQDAPYQAVYGDVSNIIDAAKDTAARSVNAAMTTAYWLIGHRIVEFEQSGEERAEYGTALIESLAEDLTGRFGRGFSRQNLQNMCLFYLAYPPDQFSRHCLANSIPHPSRWASTTFSRPFRWPGGHTCASGRSGARSARQFYEAEALRGRWSVRKVDWQIRSGFLQAYRPLKDRAAMLTWGERALPEDLVLPEGEIKASFVLEFPDLKYEYSEKDLEESLNPPSRDFPHGSGR